VGAAWHTVHGVVADTRGCGEGGAGCTQAPQLGSWAKASVTANEAAKRGSAIATDLAALRIVEPCLRLEAAPLRRT